MAERALNEVSEFGFTWGQVTVERWASHKGHLILGITTPKQVLQVRITPKGLIRLDEIKPREADPHG